MTMTLQQAAEYLGTHYMTVYRYVRLGKLPARKVGGKWEVDKQDVDALRRGAETPAGGQRSGDWSKRLEARLVAGDEAGSWGVIEGALASGSDPNDIYTDIIAPALVSVGRRWEQGDLTVADEHLASSVAVRLIGRMGPRFARKGRSRGVVVVTTPPGERHVIPSLMVSDLLRDAGFEVIDLGADMPADALAGILAGLDGLCAVCVSSTRKRADGAIRGAIGAVRRAVPQVPIFVGGSSIIDRAHAERLGADGWAADGPGAVELVRATVQ